MSRSVLPRRRRPLGFQARGRQEAKPRAHPRRGNRGERGFRALFCIPAYNVSLLLIDPPSGNRTSDRSAEPVGPHAGLSGAAERGPGRLSESAKASAPRGRYHKEHLPRFKNPIITVGERKR